MSNYTPITDFSAKDALITGDPNKLIVGSQFDAEFDAIAVAVASKLESVSQGSVTAHQAALSIAETQIPDGAVLARVASNETISGTWTISAIMTFNALPAFNGGTSGSTAPFTVDSTVVVANLNADLLDGQQGSYYTTASNLTGSLADARLSSNVPLKNGSNTFSGANVFSSTLTYGSYDVGYKEVPQNSQSVNYTCVLADNGKHILHPSGAGAGDIFTIPSNASVAYPLGTTITFVNRATDDISIAITTDTMYLGGTTTTGTRTLAENGVATAIKVSSTVWIISGTGLS
jgi:hypothetical protein